MSEGLSIHGVDITRFCGPVREDGGDRRMVALAPAAEGVVKLRPAQALEVARALIAAATNGEHLNELLEQTFDLTPGPYTLLIQLNCEAGTLARYPMLLRLRYPGDGTQLIDTIMRARDAVAPLLYAELEEDDD